MIRRPLAVAPFCLAALASPALADVMSPVGLWRTIDDGTGEARALIRIVEVGDRLEGTVEKTFPRPGEPPHPLCDKCPGERRGKPVIGMTIITGLRRTAEGWGGGEILDPDSGRTYQSKLRVVDAGRRLEVRGFLGVSLLGRTQTWERVSPAP
jgi:uncharacterized protein (DUF2147 family)